MTLGQVAPSGAGRAGRFRPTGLASRAIVDAASIRMKRTVAQLVPHLTGTQRGMGSSPVSSSQRAAAKRNVTRVWPGEMRAATASGGSNWFPSQAACRAERATAARVRGHRSAPPRANIATEHSRTSIGVDTRRLHADQQDSGGRASCSSRCNAARKILTRCARVAFQRDAAHQGKPAATGGARATATVVPRRHRRAPQPARRLSSPSRHDADRSPRPDHRCPPP